MLDAKMRDAVGDTAFVEGDQTIDDGQAFIEADAADVIFDPSGRARMAPSFSL
jgi:hypothetical protein